MANKDKQKSPIFWNHKTALAEAKKYLYRNDFRKKSNGAYNYCRVNKILNEACGHMGSKRGIARRKEFTFEACLSIAKKCQSRSELSHNYSSIYIYSKKNGWLNQICSHMNANKKWNYEECRKEALMYSNRKDFQVGSGSAYVHARKGNQ